MKYLSEYRDGRVARGIVAEIKAAAKRPWVLMEVCGGQTHTIVKQGMDELLGDAVEMIHGPGCPVCVTPLEQIDKALALAARPDVIFTSFGDMLRVPGSDCDLLQIRARGGAVRVVYSPLDALELARRTPDKQIVFFAVGFETTAPANAMAVWRAKQLGVENFSVLVSHVTVPPAMTAMLDAPDNRVQAFLAAGHVCTVMGWTEYEPIAAKYRVPIIVTGFEPLDILEGMLLAVRQLEEGRHEVENQYVRSVRRDGNQPAQDLVSRVFELVDRKWRGIGAIPAQRSGPARGVRRIRCGEAVLRGGNPHRRADGVSRRRRAAWRAQTVRLPGVRHRLHSRASARRADGVLRGGLRGLLQLRPVPRSAV